MLKKNQYIWICGIHSSITALNNTERRHKTLLITENIYKKYHTIINSFKERVQVTITTQDHISTLFAKNTTHQGIALHTSKILPPDIEQIISSKKSKSTIVILDQVTDAGNIGAILRSAAAFSVDALVLTKHNSPNESIISKTASGSLELVPLIYVNNIANLIKSAQKNGYWCYGMDETASMHLNEVDFSHKRIIILGSEESGLRKLTKENCDYLIKIPMYPKANSLNVSNAAAIVLYSAFLNKI